MMSKDLMREDPLYPLFEEIDRLALLNRQPSIEQLRAWADHFVCLDWI